MKKTLAIIALLVLVTTGAWLFLQKKTVDPVALMPAETIVVSELRFSEKMARIFPFVAAQNDQKLFFALTEKEVLVFGQNLLAADVEKIKNTLKTYRKSAFSAEKKSLAVIAESEKGLNEAIERDQKSSLAANATWQKAAKAFGDNHAATFVFLPKNSALTAKLPIAYAVDEVFDDPKGFYEQGTIYFQPDELTKLDIKPQEQNREFAIVKKIPQEDLIFYFEGFNLAGALRAAEKVFRAVNPQAADSLQAKKTAFEVAAALSIEEDIFSWLNDDFAFYLKKSAGQIPYLTLVFDAKNAPEKAKEIMKTFDQMLSMFVAAAPDLSDKIIHQAIGESLYRYSFAEAPVGMIAVIGDLSFTFGLTADNKVIFSTLPAAETLLSGEGDLTLPVGFEQGSFLMIATDKAATLPLEGLFNPQAIERYALRGTLRAEALDFEGLLELKK